MGKGFRDLKSDVIDRGLCTRCGGCFASCPVDALSFTTAGIELTGDCIECGICTSICPGAKMDLSFHENRLYGSARKDPMGTTHGIYRKKIDLSAGDIEIYKKGYFGARVTAILIHALEKGLIDGALLTDWSGSDQLSVGKGIIAKDRESIIACGSSKYVFSPVLGLLKEIADDESIKKVAIVGLPCHIHAIRNMEMDERTSHLTGKIEYLIGLNCGGANLDERKWGDLIRSLTGIERDSIGNVRIRKTSGSKIRITVVKKDDEVFEKDVSLNRYLASIGRMGVWERCMMCPDYSANLSDLTFGMPYIRTKKGEELVNSAMESGNLVRSSMKRRLSQNIVDMAMPFRKIRTARNNIRRRKRESKPYPIYT